MGSMRRLPIALIAVGAFALSSCSASGTGTTGSSSKEPIVVGSINALSGPATFSEASQAAKAVFDEVNATGGIQGRQIKYEITDDKGDPATA
ncbi:MAG: ABC transporter substrate-binding protein, partial [Chloroflexia bacterium]